MPEISSAWEIYERLVRQYYPEDICPHCYELHPRLILSGTFKRERKPRWIERCGGTEFEVVAGGYPVGCGGDS